MKYFFLFIISFISIHLFPYEWIEIGDFDEIVWKYHVIDGTNIQVVGVEDGLYVNSGTEWDFFYRGLRVLDIVSLDQNSILVADGSGSCLSAGLWEFDLTISDYIVVMFAWAGLKLLHCNDNYYYIAGNYWQSSNGLDWNFYNYWDNDFVWSVAVHDNNVVVSTENNVYVSNDEGITFIPAEPEISNIEDLVFSHDGVLYARTPYTFEESIVYVSYDYGMTWDELFFGSYIGRIGVDSSGRLFVGWRGYPENSTGVAYWDELSQELVYLNDNLPNLAITRLQPYEHNGDSSIICCTHEGLYFLTDYVYTADSEIVNGPFEISHFPNPFNPSLSISFDSKSDCFVDVTIFNINGQKIKTITRNDYLKGNHLFTWDGNDEFGNQVGSGLYFYRMVVDNKFEVIKKCVLLK
ncbi:MAG: hypothetical protein APR63_09410 [Desulfuromonas sp. SDB]|nr:MAG: hypothetical protein APR63_09410 [Desulfuromonas sp. SDB]